MHLHSNKFDVWQSDMMGGWKRISHDMYLQQAVNLMFTVINYLHLRAEIRPSASGEQISI